MRAFTSTIHAGPSAGTMNSTLKKPPSKPSAGMMRCATSASSAWRSADRALGYSNRSKLSVPGYLTESVTPITVTRPSCTYPSSVTSAPEEQLLGEEPRHRRRVAAGERDDLRVALRVARGAGKPEQVVLGVDPEGVLREPPDHRLDEERERKGRPRVEEVEARRRLGRSLALDRAGGRLVLDGERRPPAPGRAARGGRPRSTARSAERVLRAHDAAAGRRSASARSSAGAGVAGSSRSPPTSVRS